MRRLKHLLLAAMFSMVIAMPALASEEKVVSQARLQEGLTDASLVFETDATQPMQLVELSSQEMKETEGAKNHTHINYHRHSTFQWHIHRHIMWRHHSSIYGA